MIVANVAIDLQLTALKHDQNWYLKLGRKLGLYK